MCCKSTCIYSSINLAVCFWSNRICNSVFIQNLHLSIVYSLIKLIQLSASMFTLIHLYIIISNSHFCPHPFQIRKIYKSFSKKKTQNRRSKMFQNRLWSTEILQQRPHGDVVHLKGPHGGWVRKTILLRLFPIGLKRSLFRGRTVC